MGYRGSRCIPKVFEITRIREFQNVGSRDIQDFVGTAITLARILIERAKLSHGRSGGQKWTIESQQKSLKSAEEFPFSRKEFGFYRSKGSIFSFYFCLCDFSLSTVSHLLKGDGNTIPAVHKTTLRYTQNALMDPS